MFQNNVTLFGHLKNEDGNLREFFAHEIQSFPVPSISLRLWQDSFDKYKVTVAAVS